MSATATEVPTRRAAGYAVVYDAKSQTISPGFVERISRSAIEHALRQKTDTLALWSHETSELLARVSNGTLRLQSDGRGLHVDIAIARTTTGDNLVALLERRDVKGLSFGFQVLEDEWMLDGGTPLRTVTKLILYEVSPVALPAYRQTELKIV